MSGLDFPTTDIFTPKKKRHRSKTVSNKNPHAVALGRLGGLKGGNARSKRLPPSRRTEIASKAANSRWAKYRKEKRNKRKS